MFESRYDNRLAGGGNDAKAIAKAGVAKGKTIISKWDSKVKKIGRRKRRARSLVVWCFLKAKVVQRLPK